MCTMYISCFSWYSSLLFIYLLKSVYSLQFSRNWSNIWYSKKRSFWYVTKCHWFYWNVNCRLCQWSERNSNPWWNTVTKTKVSEFFSANWNSHLYIPEIKFLWKREWMKKKKKKKRLNHKFVHLIFPVKIQPFWINSIMKSNKVNCIQSIQKQLMS